MDENYLDQLLKNIENEVMTEEELESPNPSISEMVIPESEPELEETLAKDAEHIQDVAWADSEIPIEEISELDRLDEMADLDMNTMDFDDIDFDDIDITKMNMNPVQFQKELEDLSDLDIDETYLDETEDAELEQVFQNRTDDDGYVDTLTDGEGYIDTLTEPVKPAAESPLEAGFDGISNIDGSSDFDMGMDTGTSPDMEMNMSMDMEMKPDMDLNPDVPADTEDIDIDSLINEVFSTSDEADVTSEPAEEMKVEADMDTDTEETAAGALDAGVTTTSQSDNENMEELFAMLGIEGNPDASASIPETDEIPDFEIPPELEDVPDVSEIKEKRNRFLDILFGDDTEDELTPEQEAELAAKKEEKLQAKLAKKEEKKNKKAESDAKRKSDKESKSAKLAAKKAAQKAEDEKLLAEEGPDKKLNKVLVALVMIFFFSIGGFVILGTNIFDYTLAITKTADYFQRQKYSMAYREILGVEVKEQDRELENKVYTVMYVERQYEAYENYVKLMEPDLALNALVQGLGKYDDYYEDAVALGIVDDLNNARGKIISALNSDYGMSTEEALALLELEPAEYSRQIQSRSADITFSVPEE